MKETDFNYPEKVRFACLRCGICCGDTNQKQRHILLISSEAERISALVRQPTSRFSVEIEGRAPYLFEMKKTQADQKCIFLENNKCRIYKERPIICRFYPFELRVSMNEKPRFLYTNECPGIGKGRFLSEIHFRRLFRISRRHAKARAKSVDGIGF